MALPSEDDIDPDLGLLQKFNQNVLKSIHTHSPKINASTSKHELDDDDIDAAFDEIQVDGLHEPPKKRLRSSSNDSNLDLGLNLQKDDAPSDEESTGNDDEFDQIFEIEENDNTKIPGMECRQQKPRATRYFDALLSKSAADANSNDSDDEDDEDDDLEHQINETEIMEKIRQNVRTEKGKNINFKCYNCDEVGHIARNCTFDPIDICFLCGECGHSGFYCPNAVCSFCLQSHAVYECPLFKPKTFRFCIRCGSKEHFFNKCNVSLKTRVSELQCFVCGQTGHLNCKAVANGIRQKHEHHQASKHAKRAKRVTLCSNCGEHGHTVYFCKYLRMNKMDIALGLTTSNHEPKVCFHCLTPMHEARNCPIILRQKQHRHKHKKRPINFTHPLQRRGSRGPK